MPSGSGTGDGADAEAALAAFLDRFEPDIRDGAAAAIARLRRLAPQADAMIYDNYAGLVVGFSPTERPSDAILSIVAYPRKYSLCFLQGAALSDPDGLLQGYGNVVRHISLSSPDDMDRPDIAAAILRALQEARIPIPVERTGRLYVQSVSTKQRPRRP